MRRLALAVTMALSTCLGCQYWYHPWFLVELDAKRSMQSESKSDVTLDRSISAPIPLVIALLAPDKCWNRGAATTSGMATTAAVVLQVDCGESMGSIERAIVSRNWRVISWKSIDQAVATGNASNAIEAAAKFGANVVMQINSLEISLVPPFGTVEIKRTIRKSNHRGTAGPPIVVDAKRAEALDAMVAPHIESLKSTNQPGAYLDVTIIIVETGRSAWFYKWNHHALDPSMEVSISKLFLCHRRNPHRCLPRDLKAKTGSGSTMAQASAQTTIPLGGPDQSQAVNAIAKRLLDEATEDMLDKVAIWGAGSAH